MKKILLLLFICWSSTALADVDVNIANFPDANFRLYVGRFDTDSDLKLSASELNAITSIDVKALGIASLKGIEHLTAITSLDCSNNKLRTLNLANNTLLTSLDASSQKLEINTLIATGSSIYPYRLNIDELSFDLSDLDRVKNLQVFDESGNEIKYTPGLSLNFASKPRTLTYEYNTQAAGLSSSESAYMSVNVTLNTSATEASNAASREWRYKFTVTSELMNVVKSDFSLSDENSIFQLSDSEITSEKWTLDREDENSMRNVGENVIFSLPVINPANSGVYIVRYYLDKATVGRDLNLHRVGIIASTLQDIEYSFYDKNCKAVSAVPTDRTVYLAMRMTTGQAYQVAITHQSPSPIKEVDVIPVASQDELAESIAEILDIGEDEVNFVTSNQISEAKEVSAELRKEITGDKYELVGGLATISIDTPGYYAFKVKLSSDIYNELKDIDVKDIKLYGVTETAEGSELSIEASFLDLLSDFVILALSGVALSIMAAEFVVVCYVAYPMSFYMAKPGTTVIVHECHHCCNLNYGLIALLVVVGFFAYKFLRQKYFAKR